MKSVVKYQDRCKTIFCTNCRGRAFEVPLKVAEELARNQTPVHCNDCAPEMAEVLALEQTMQRSREDHEEFIRLHREATMKEIAVLEAKRELIKGRLQEIAEHRLYEYRGSAGLN